MPKPPDAAPEQKKYSYETPESKESRNRVLLLIGIMLVLVIVGIGVLVFLFMGGVPPSGGISVPGVAPPENASNLTVPPYCDDDCYLQLALNATSPDFCRSIKDPARKNGCFVALSNVSMEACVAVQDHATLKDCVLRYAVQNNDTDLCLYLPEPDSTECMGLLDPCYQLSGTPMSICLALEKRDSSFCGYDKACIINYTETTGDAGACSLISETAGQYACTSVALDKDKCSDLQLKSERDLCYQIYAIKTDDKALCSAISPDSIYMIECLSYFAVKLNDYTVCDTDALKFNNRWNCYSNYSFGTGNSSGCVAIDKLATTSRFSCMYQFAKMWGDPSACDLIGDPGESVTCYVGSIMNNTRLDYAHCQGIGPYVWRNKCYMQSAKLANDTTFCLYITTENESKSCVNEVTGK